MSNISTVLIKSKDKALTLAASSALSELDGYRLIFCEDDNSAKSRLNEVNIDLILYDFDEDGFGPDNLWCGLACLMPRVGELSFAKKMN